MATTFAGAHVLGDQEVVNFGNLKFWAERGLIHIENTRDGDYDSISVRVALQRMRAIQDMLGNRRTAHTEDQFDQQRRKEHQDMLDGLVCLCQKAQIQGMPSDPSAVRDLKRRAKRTIVMPGLKDSM